MKLLLRLEELAMLLASIALLYMAEANWWWYLLLLLGPDISMLGYLAGNSAGAFFYNLFHHKGIGILLLVAGFYMYVEYLFLESGVWAECMIYAGAVIIGHSSMDRMLGYGLKYNRGFKYTHLGFIGKESKDKTESKNEIDRS